MAKTAKQQKSAKVKKAKNAVANIINNEARELIDSAQALEVPVEENVSVEAASSCRLYTSPSPRD